MNTANLPPVNPTAEQLAEWAAAYGHTLVTVECRCRACRADAATLGRERLVAEATEAFVARFGKHRTVQLANDPELAAGQRFFRQVIA